MEWIKTYKWDLLGADKKFKKWDWKDVTFSKSWAPLPPRWQSNYVKDEFSPQKSFVFHL